MHGANKEDRIDVWDVTSKQRWRGKSYRLDLISLFIFPPEGGVSRCGRVCIHGDIYHASPFSVPTFLCPLFVVLSIVCMNADDSIN